jgi:hypothetical protein
MADNIRQDVEDDKNLDRSTIEGHINGDHITIITAGESDLDVYFRRKWRGG